MQRAALYEYVNLHYTKEDRSAGVFRASPNHGMIMPSQAILASNPQVAPGPGTLKAMSDVQVGPEIPPWVLNLCDCLPLNERAIYHSRKIAGFY